MNYNYFNKNKKLHPIATLSIEMKPEMSIEIIVLPDSNWIFDKRVIRKNDPVSIAAVTKYVKNLRDKIFQNEKPIFYHTIS